MGSCTSGGRSLIIRVTVKFLFIYCNCPWAIHYSNDAETQFLTWADHCIHRVGGAPCFQWQRSICFVGLYPNLLSCHWWRCSIKYRFERAHCSGALQHAHLPLSPQFAVPCGAPDVACRIIHAHALMKVSIWPPMHTLSPQNHICMGKLKKILYRPVVTCLLQYELSMLLPLCP